MPTDLRRRDEIAAAVAAYDSANPSAPLPRNAARLLAAMFPAEDVCQRSLEAIAAKGSAERPCLGCCGASSRPGSCRGSRVRPLCPTPIGCTCRRCGHEDAAAARRCSALAAPCRWTATPRPALPPTRAPGTASTASRARGAEPWAAPPWTFWAPCYGCSTTPAPASAFPATRRSPRRPAVPASTVAEA